MTADTKLSAAKLQESSLAHPAPLVPGASSTPRLDLPARDFVDAFANAPVGIAVTDSVGAIIRVNAAFAAMLGEDAEDLVGKTVRDLTHPDDLAASVREIERLRNGEIRAFTIEKRYVGRGGRIVWA